MRDSLGKRQPVQMLVKEIGDAHINIGVAHEILEKHVLAVRDMLSVLRIGHTVGKPITVVMHKIYVHAQDIQAVNLMEDVDFNQIGVVSQTHLVGVFGQFGRIISRLPELRRTDRAGFGVG